MKFVDIIEKNVRNKSLKRYVENKVPEPIVTPSIVDKIYEFAGDTADKAQLEFDLTRDQGDLVYNLVIASLKFSKGYPKDK